MKASEHEILKKIQPFLFSPRVIPSMAALSKRARISDDAMCRLAQRFEREHGFSLITVEQGRLILTEKGRRAYELYSELWSLGDAEDGAVAKMRLQAEAILGAWLLPRALVAVFDLWASAIDRPSIFRLESSIRRDISEGKTDLGLGFADAGETVADAEALGPPVNWCVLAPAGHRLGQAQEPVPLDHLPKEGWLLFPDLAFGSAGLADSFVRAGHRQVMECDHLVQYVSADVGLAVLPDVLGSRCPHGTIKRRLIGLAPITVRLFLPRGEAALSSAANQSLVENLRRVMQEGLSCIDNGTAASTTAVSKQEMLEPEKGAEDVFEESVEESINQMAEASS